MIISASRRTDIPAFYVPWLLQRLREGFCEVENPYNPRQVSRVSLRPADVEAIVFWSKNPAPLIPHLDELSRMGYCCGFLLTVNDYPAALEPGVPPLAERIRTFRVLASRAGVARVVWRYDPILLSRRLDEAYHAETFKRLAECLDGCTERVIVSFADFYRKTERRLRQIEQATGDTFCRDPFVHPAFRSLVETLVRTARAHDLRIQSCAEDPRLASHGIPPGACLDASWIRSALGVEVAAAKDRGQRETCLCASARDIGAVDTCLHGCEYCYATASAAAARPRHARHDPHAARLVPGSRVPEAPHASAALADSCPLLPPRPRVAGVVPALSV